MSGSLAAIASRIGVLVLPLVITAAATAAGPPPGAASCSGCHPASAAVRTPVPLILGRKPDEIIAAMQAFRSGERPSTVMGRIAKGFSDDEIRAIAIWLAAQQEELRKANSQLTQVIESNKQVLNTLSLGEMLRTNYGEGVCLIYGSYTFVEAGTGRPLRIAESQSNESGSTVQNGTNQPELTPEGNGQIAEYPFVGTGFHTGDGFILTNRHVVQPWLADERAQSLTSTVKGKPRLKKLMAFFPDNPQPITLKYKQAASGEDVAVCTIDPKDIPPKTPVLPLEKASDSVAIGRIVVTMGYPSGPDRLLAMLDESEARGIQNRYGSTESLLSYLGQTKRIRPLMTQGNITDLDARRIVYDARTGEGGSGGPLFGPSGRVIGITFAIFTENTASNFAVPIHFAISLLEKSGWTAPAVPEPEQKDAANTSQAGAR